MNELLRFNSKEKKYKTPFGAVVCGECVKLSAYVLRSEIKSLGLILFSENAQSESAFEMVWEERNGEYDLYTAELPGFSDPGVYWYFFKLVNYNGEEFYCGKNGYHGEKSAVISHQLTVYSSDYKTPSWFSRGVTYHVFVDRFYRAKEAGKLSSDDYFYVHGDYSETPYFRPNENGVVENRDIYGGNLDGIIEKLPYLESLGVRTIYLSPIFEAWSNHKYNTADYKKVDSHFGDEEVLKKLCRAAKDRGMRVILDGVFSHTGSDSIYFNREGRYGENVGAWRDKASPFRAWYDINDNGTFSSWWGIDTLPQVNETNDEYLDYIVRSRDSVISHWMDAGVSGWRLDVADELPDVFIAELKKKAREKSCDALVIGEVWEDASTKKAYGVNKTYFTEGVLDGVMNYPLKNGILDFLCERCTAKDLKDSLEALCENYPDISKRCLMNIIGTHDTVRAVNELSVGALGDKTKDFRAEYTLSEGELKKGKSRLRLAAVLQYTFPGSPCIYYGDEIGMQGFEDPFNRRFFTWDNMDDSLLSFYRDLGKIKLDFKALHDGDYSVLYAKGDIIVIKRDNIYAAVNRGSADKMFKIPKESGMLLSYNECEIHNSFLFLGREACCIFESKK